MKNALTLIWSLGLLAVSSAAIAQPLQHCRFDKSFLMTTSSKNDGKPSKINQTVTNIYNLNNLQSQERIGTAIVKTTNIGLNSATTGPNALYEQTSTLLFKDGTIVTLGMNDFDAEAYKYQFERAIVGGTGKYSGITGSFVVTTEGNGQFKIVSHATIPCHQ